MPSPLLEHLLFKGLTFSPNHMPNLCRSGDFIDLVVHSQDFMHNYRCIYFRNGTVCKAELICHCSVRLLKQLTRPSSLDNRHSLVAGKTKIKVLTDLVLGEGHLPGLHYSHGCFLTVLMWFRERVLWSLPLRIRALILS